MYESQTRQKYEWISGGCEGILKSPHINKFYYSEKAVKIDKTVELGILDRSIRVCKDKKIYNPRFACGAAYIQGLGVGVYNILVKLPIGKHLNPEIRLVNMFDENKSALYVLRGFTGNHKGYRKLFKKNYNIFSFIRSGNNISNMYIHKRKDYPINANNSLIHIKLIVTGDCIIMKVHKKTLFAVSKIEVREAIESLDKIASLAMTFSLNVDSDYQSGDLKENFKIVSFDFMSLHEIDDAIDK